nr:glycosyltransferase [uncultured Sellimonas sp.]
MKIIIFSDNVAPYRIAWADEMGKNNDVTFVYVKDKDAERNDDWLVKNSSFAKMVKIPAFVIKNHAVTMNVIRYIKKNSADVIIFDGYGTIPNMLGMVYMILCKRQFFINVDGVVLDAKETPVKHIIKKFLFCKYAYFLCSSEFTERWIQSFGVANKRTIAHNFSSLHAEDILEQTPSVQERIDAKKSLGLKNLPTVIAVGRFMKLKQFDMLIEAFRKYDNDNQLLIIGEGSEKSTYEKKIKEYSLKNVKIIEFMPFDRLKKYYYASDLLVLPSYSEVWGLVVNEGMGCGALPVIVSDRCVAGYNLAKNGITGYQFKFDCVNDLEKKMGLIINNKELRERMSEASLREVRKYTVENIAKIHLQWFEQFVSEE